MIPLNNKQKRFVEEYLIDFNASRAAVAAGYSKENPRQIGYELINKPHIRNAMEKEQNKTSEKLGLTREELINNLIDIKNGDEKQALKAIEMLLKANGWNMPDKMEHSGSAPIAINIIKPEDNND